MDFPNDENGDVLRRLVSNGDNLSKPRDIDFVVVFPNEDAAQDFASQIGEQGHKVIVDRTAVAKGLPWDARVVRYMVPTHQEITAFEGLLGELAEPYGGRNDGWGCIGQTEPVDRAENEWQS